MARAAFDRACIAALLALTGCNPQPVAGPAAERAPSAEAPIAVVTASARHDASAADAAKTPAFEVQEHMLDAVVEAVGPLGSGQRVWPVDADPRFVLVLSLRGVAPSMADDPKGSALVAGETVSFAIHSPARLFGADSNPVGQRFRFQVTRAQNGGVAYSGLRIVP